MSKDKYPSIFSPRMGAIVFIILQIFFATRAIFKIGGIFSEQKDLMDFKLKYSYQWADLLI